MAKASLTLQGPSVLEEQWKNFRRRGVLRGGGGRGESSFMFFVFFKLLTTYCLCLSMYVLKVVFDTFFAIDLLGKVRFV